jgi:hypothetical protein
MHQMKTAHSASLTIVNSSFTCPNRKEIQPLPGTEFLRNFT